MGSLRMFVSTASLWPVAKNTDTFPSVSITTKLLLNELKATKLISSSDVKDWTGWMPCPTLKACFSSSFFGSSPCSCLMVDLISFQWQLTFKFVSSKTCGFVLVSISCISLLVILKYSGMWTVYGTNYHKTCQGYHRKTKHHATAVVIFVFQGILLREDLNRLSTMPLKNFLCGPFWRTVTCPAKIVKPPKMSTFDLVATTTFVITHSQPYNSRLLHTRKFVSFLIRWPSINLRFNNNRKVLPPFLSKMMDQILFESNECYDLRVDGLFKIGRSPLCQATLRDTHVSKMHCSLNIRSKDDSSSRYVNWLCMFSSCQDLQSADIHEGFIYIYTYLNCYNFFNAKGLSL